MQADCFAGAWTRHIADGTDTSLHLGAGDLDTALGGFLVFRDPVGTDGGQSGAHGNAFDRVSAFQDGYRGGTASCRDYENRPPDVTETGFTSQQDAANGGNVSEDEVQQLVTDDLTRLLGSGARQGRARRPRSSRTTAVRPPARRTSDGGVLDDGATYCAGTNTIAYDQSHVRPALLRRR